MADLDSAFIRPIERRPKLNTPEAEDPEIPVIDLSVTTGAEDSPSDNTVSKIGEACKKWGFFQVINHGVPLHKLEKVEELAREFFSLPLEEKSKARRTKADPLGYFEAELTKNVRDWKEVFDFTWHPTVTPVSLDDLEAKPLVEQWPDQPSNFRERCQDYGREVETLANKLMELVALSLGLRGDRFRGFFEDHTSYIRLNHYPPCPSPELALGVGSHKDSDALTILAQDGVGGLEVRRKSDGEWIQVRPVPGAYVINIGDIIQVWSYDKYESVEHRVAVNTEKDRISIPFFFNPAHYVMVKPLEELVDGHNPFKYKELWNIFRHKKGKQSQEVGG